MDLSRIARDLAPTGALRASINLGNPVLAHGTPQAPAGVSVDIAREVGERLGVPVTFLCFDSARASYQAMAQRQADVCFLAVDPAREEDVAFTAPYVVIEGVYVVPQDSALTSPEEVDAEGVRIGVKHGSAYDLHLSRALEHASVVRGSEGVEVFVEQGLEAGAGIRQPVTAFVQGRAGYRLIEEPFTQIRQAVGTARTRAPETVDFLAGVVEELKASGFVARSLRASGQSETLLAPPA